MNFVSLHNHSMFSMLDGIAKPPAMAKRAVELGHTAIALTDHGNLGGIPSFLNVVNSVCICGEQESEHIPNMGCRKKGSICKKFEKYPLKALLGQEFYVCGQDSTLKTPENRSLSHLVILSKNKAGWKSLVHATSFANKKERKYYFPRLTLDEFEQFSNNNLIAMAGHPGSILSDCIFTDKRSAYNAITLEEAKEYRHPERLRILTREIEKLIHIFGKENVILEAQLLEPELMPAQIIISEAMRFMAKKFGLKCVATGDAHYVEAKDASDQRVVLCSALKTTMRTVGESIKNGEDVTLGGFFKSSRYGILSADDLTRYNTEEEIVCTQEVSDMCESYDIRRNPMMPHYPCPDGLSADQYLRQLCLEGWDKKIKGKIPKEKLQAYKDEVKKELAVFEKAGLAPYFLSMAKIVNWAKERMFVGDGRGSSAGCLVSYLTNITNVDPVLNELYFERFYNEGRNSATKISLPDIDTDFEKSKRHLVIKFIQDEFGHDKVGQVCTFNSMKGKSSLKDVFRSWDVSFDIVNKITEGIIDESKLAEELQEIRENGGDPSVIRYSIEANPGFFKEFVYFNNDGELEGEYARYFQQAMRLEGIKRNTSKHPSAVVVGPEPLAELCPMIYDDKSDSYLGGMEFSDLEAIGLVKLDILGLNALDKLHSIQNFLLYGHA